MSANPEMRDKTLATRGDIGDVRAAIAEVNRRIDRLEERMDAGFAELRRANQNTNRIGIGILFAIFALVAHLVAAA